MVREYCMRASISSRVEVFELRTRSPSSLFTTVIELCCMVLPSFIVYRGRNQEGLSGGIAEDTERTAYMGKSCLSR